MSTLSTSATATPAAAVDSCKATESLRDISSGNNNKEDSEKSKSTTSQRETSTAAAARKNKRNQLAPVVWTIKNNSRPAGVQHCSKRSRSCRAPHNTNRFLINDHKKQQQQQQHPPYSYCSSDAQRHNRSSAARRTFQNTREQQQHLDSPYLPHLTPDDYSHNSLPLGDNRGGSSSSCDGKCAHSSSVANSKRFVSPADLDLSQS
ncbi:MAG: hypothetical protein MHMPM18_002290, partial [Marteilia pararefringens]